MAVNLTRLKQPLKTIARNLPRVAREYGINAQITSGYRSRAQQAKLYSDYINGYSQYPANPPGYSMHEKGMAIDVVADDQDALTDLLTGAGLVWGGPSDPIHYQIGQNKALASLQTQKVDRVDILEAQKQKIIADSINEDLSHNWFQVQADAALTWLSNLF